MGDDYQEVRNIRVVKRQPQDGKVKRWFVNPAVKLAKWKVDDPKKERVSA